MPRGLGRRKVYYQVKAEEKLCIIHFLTIVHTISTIPRHLILLVAPKISGAELRRTPRPKPTEIQVPIVTNRLLNNHIITSCSIRKVRRAHGYHGRHHFPSLAFTSTDPCRTDGWRLFDLTTSAQDTVLTLS